jgi:hypothetical protein
MSALCLLSGILFREDTALGAPEIEGSGAETDDENVPDVARTVERGVEPVLERCFAVARFS